MSKELIDAAFPLTGANVAVSRNGLFPGFFSLLDHFWISSRGATPRMEKDVLPVDLSLIHISEPTRP